MSRSLMRVSRATSLLLLFTGCIGALKNDIGLLTDAQRRRCSNARAAFTAAVQDPMLKQPDYNPLDLATLIAAEERSMDAMVMPHEIRSSIGSRIEQLVAPAAQRLALERSVSGKDAEPEGVVDAVSTALFGSAGSPDDNSNGYFQTCVADSPASSLLDSVVERRRGTPLCVALIASDACAQLGVSLVGIATPERILLAPRRAPDDENAPPFVLDCSSGAGLLLQDQAAEVVAMDLGASGSEPLDKRLGYGRAALRSLHSAPLTALQWGSAMLRCLRRVHEEDGDVVRLLGVCDRLRLIGAHSRLAVSDEEMQEYAAQVALCIYELRWTQRRAEAKVLLNRILQYAKHPEGRGKFDDASLARVEDLLEQPFFGDQE